MLGSTEEIIGRWLKGGSATASCWRPSASGRWGRGRSMAASAGGTSCRAEHASAAAEDRRDRPVPTALVRPAHAGRRDAAGVRRARASGQGPVRGLLELPGLAAGPRARPQRGAGHGAVRSVQPRYNLLYREIEPELIPLCIEDGLGAIAYNPLAGGFLSGKHDRRRRPRARALPSAPRAGCTASATGTTARSTPSTRSRPRPTRRGFRCLDYGRGVGAGPAGDHQPIGASRPDQLDASFTRPPRHTLAPDLLAKLDELTRQYRMGDAPR